MSPEIKEKLLGLINEKAYNPLKREELALIFDIHSCEMPMFNNFLEELQDARETWPPVSFETGGLNFLLCFSAKYDTLNLIMDN